MTVEQVKAPVLDHWYVTVGLTAAIFLSQVLAALGRAPDARRLTEGSPEFTQYFAEWYGRPGSLMLYCKDLNWLEMEGSAPIKSALEKKASSKTLEIFLFELEEGDCEMARDLVRKGAKAFEVQTPRLESRMSIRPFEERTELIIRLKLTYDSKKHDINIIREHYDDAYCKLALDLMQGYRRFPLELDTTTWKLVRKFPRAGEPVTVGG